MANSEQVERLKASVEDWNNWRKENPDTKINLFQADFSWINLRNADLSHADLTMVKFIGSDLTLADLTEANLFKADLTFTKLDATDLLQSNFADVRLGYATFSNIDLSKINNLEGVFHEYPSSISTDTIQLSKGEIPEAFLRGCGLSDWEIESAKLYKPNLSNQEINNIIYKVFDLRARRAIQISPLFISYNHADKQFVEKIEKNLMEMGVLYWRDVHHATAGRLEKQIDHAMRRNPTVLLILSKNSVNSDWVEHEARSARELEKELKRDVLCPIALDDSWKTCSWPRRLMEQIMEYNILDFSKWEHDETFEQMFSKMITGLNVFYKK